MADQGVVPPPQGAWGQPNQGQQGQGRGRGRGGYNNQQQQQQPQLPPGWQLAFAPTGEPYYVDHNTRTTHWQLPAQYQALNQQQQSSFGGRGGARGGRGGRVGIDGNKRKTKMCMNFENGSCAWGDKCAFAHGAQELLSTNNQGGNNGAQQQGAPQKPAGAQ